METTIQKWGNSQGVRIALPFLKQANIALGDAVSVTVQDDSIVLRKIVGKKFDIVEMVKEIPAEYSPSEVVWGTSTGKEVW